MMVGDSDLVAFSFFLFFYFLMKNEDERQGIQETGMEVVSVTHVHLVHQSVKEV